MWWRAMTIAGVTLTMICSSAMAQSADPRAPEPQAAPKPVDPASCFAAIQATEDDGIIATCAALIDSVANPSADRVKALLARAAAFAHKSDLDRAIADYNAALKHNPFVPDALNARGEVWRTKGERPRAIMDFSAALRIDPQHAAARANRKSLAQEIERVGAEMPLRGRPK